MASTCDITQDDLNSFQNRTGLNMVFFLGMCASDRKNGRMTESIWQLPRYSSLVGSWATITDIARGAA